MAPTRGRQHPGTSASRRPRALRPPLGPATITPVERPSSRLRRTAARKHSRSSRRDGARGPRRPGRARMTPTGQPRSSYTRPPSVSPRTLARSPAPAARPRCGHSRKGGVGGAGRPALLRRDTRTAPAADPQDRPALHQLGSALPPTGAPGCAVVTPASVLSAGQVREGGC